MDVSGAVWLSGFSLILAFNQVVIKLTSGGLQPVFMASLRSFLALAVLGIWMWSQNIAIFPKRHNIWSALLMGFLFYFEFVLLFQALDWTTVSRASLLFYTMPIWLAISAHFLLPNETLTPKRILGLIFAILGVALALLDRPEEGEASLTGDIMALVGAFGWAGIALCARVTRISEERAETILFAQLLASGPLLLLSALFFGPFVREVDLFDGLGLLFQVFVASYGFLLWFRLIGIYEASSVVSFSFLAPVLSVALGWLILAENAGWNLVFALVLVTAGLILINRK
ncbi:MAG: DMT family transporter [Rhodobacteraceae bacterium]|jgi:drug/metabolite transporter (DMT)-like permease|nr:DMT family transporter [Paracoccaceae bacterium]